jgi:hypothetical protein
MNLEGIYKEWALVNLVERELERLAQQAQRVRAVAVRQREKSHIMKVKKVPCELCGYQFSCLRSKTIHLVVYCYYQMLMLIIYL